MTAATAFITASIVLVLLIGLSLAIYQSRRRGRNGAFAPRVQGAVFAGKLYYRKATASINVLA
jgi:hypothetical protein